MLKHYYGHSEWVWTRGELVTVVILTGVPVLAVVMALLGALGVPVFSPAKLLLLWGGALFVGVPILVLIGGFLWAIASLIEAIGGADAEADSDAKTTAKDQYVQGELSEAELEAALEQELTADQSRGK